MKHIQYTMTPEFRYCITPQQNVPATLTNFINENYLDFTGLLYCYFFGLSYPVF